jgi:Oxidoreductase family, NAD-binding Rossmann fold/Oxidoreductase family, C-terminal alpha/beta domain
VLAVEFVMTTPPQPDRRVFLAASGATVLTSSTMQAKSLPPLAPPDKQSADAKIPDAPKKQAGWAIVGLGKLALEEVLPAFAHAKRSKPVALVSGHPDKAKKVAEAFSIDAKNIYDYKNYDMLRDNPAVDVIYIILPNSMHAEYTVRGLKAGKNVLCEKPLAASVTEAEQMIAAAKSAKKKLMTAYRLRYEPFNIMAIDMLKKGGIGKIKSITASHCQNVEAPNIRLSKELKGGPVEDVGIYCLNACRYLTGEEPVEVTAIAHQPKDDPLPRGVRECAVDATLSVRHRRQLRCFLRHHQECALSRAGYRGIPGDGPGLHVLRPGDGHDEGQPQATVRDEGSQPVRRRDGSLQRVRAGW